jgi:TIR domain
VATCGWGCTNQFSLTSFRLLVIEEKLDHQITLVLRASSRTLMVASRCKLAERMVELITCLHRLVQERYRWMTLKSFVEPSSADRWCMLETTPKSAGRPKLVTVHKSKFGIKHTLEDVVTSSSRSIYRQEESCLCARPVCSIDEVEELIALKPPTQRAAREDHLRKLIDTEKELVKWLATLSCLEVTKRYTPIDLEIGWIKRIARFYHVFVSCLKQYYLDYVKKNTSELFKVFVSHAGEDKDAYASPLAGYLKEKGIKTFLDRRSLRWGADPQDAMLHAAITSKYMWCVLSVDFAKKFYPMRELMIGYTRHTQEDREDFCLIVDCFEKQTERGQWMDRILNEIQSLRVYDRLGRNVPFPVMRPAVTGEDFSERYRRLAALKLADGKVLAQSHLAQQAGSL